MAETAFDIEAITDRFAAGLDHALQGARKAAV